MHTIWLATNYTIRRTTDEVIARMMMYVLWWTVSQYLEWWTIKKQREKKAVSVLQNYRWPLEEYVNLWNWHNIVPSILRNEFATLISWTTVTPTFKANYIALWNWTSTPANTDNTLQSETIRWLFTNRNAVENVAYLDKFFSSAEVWWNSYLELWIFVDGTWSADTWYLLSRILITETLGANETLTVNATFTIS